MELPPEPNDSNGQNRSKWWWTRWAVHLVVLGSYPALLGLLSAAEQQGEQDVLLPRDPVTLLAFMGETMLQFGMFFGVAWLFSRASKEQLLLLWRGGIAPLWRGFLYSIALRLLVMVVGLLVVLVIVIIKGSSVLESIRPPAESVIDPQALATNPLYLILNLTLVSFVLAGFREELWRAGVFAALWALFPKLRATVWGQALTVLVVALLFGLGHLPQGWLGVGLTTLLGLALGAIMVFHRSIWDAAIAHGFFDATTFLMLYVIAKMGWKLGG